MNSEAPGETVVVKVGDLTNSRGGKSLLGRQERRVFWDLHS